MKEHPKIFNTEGIKAILDNRKTQFREIIKPQPRYDPPKVQEIWKPKYQVGDRLWVRETWKIVGWPEGGGFWIKYKNGSKCFFEPDEWACDEEHYEKYTIQCSDDCIDAGLKTDEDNGYFICDGELPTRWRSPIFMPKWAASIWLEVTKVRVERVQNISIEDIIAEGIQPVGDELCEVWDEEHINRFIKLWDSLNAKRGYGWEKNPLIRVYDFKRLK